MHAKKLIECCDCHEIFESACSNSKRCPECQKAWRKKRMKDRYQERKTLGILYRDRPKRDVVLLNLPCPWADDRLPESVTRNQLWR